MACVSSGRGGLWLGKQEKENTFGTSSIRSDLKAHISLQDMSTFLIAALCRFVNLRFTPHPRGPTP